MYTLRGCLTVRSDPKKNRFMEITLQQAKQLTTPYFQDEAKNCTDLV